jgi:NAD(P)-dependent dehydrogenase (short-subunit alcohol dehydrogenase family)
VNAGETKSGRILITGGTSGLGLELVRSFLRLGYEVYSTGRNQKNVLNLNDKFHFIKADFSDLKEVTAAFHDLEKKSISFDTIINNAGVLSPPEFTLTGDGIEYTFQVNFLSHFLIDELILRKRSNTDPLTMVFVTSPVYKYIKTDFKVPLEKDYHSFKIYAKSKLYLLLIGEYLIRKYPGKKLRFIGFNPGTFSSGIYRMQNNWFKSLYRIAAPFMRSPEDVAFSLTEILGQEQFVNRSVYSFRKSFRDMDSIFNERNNEFLKECQRYIEPYLFS